MRGIWFEKAMREKLTLTVKYVCVRNKRPPPNMTLGHNISCHLDFVFGPYH